MIEIKRILCPTDFSPASLSAFPHAAEIARLFNAQIFVIYVVPPIPPPVGGFGMYNVMALEDYITGLRADADKKIDQILREQIPKGVQASKVIKEGDAATEILKAVENLQIDLVTIATHGRTGWHHLVFGSVAEKVIRMCKVPVLTVREKVIESEKPE